MKTPVNVLSDSARRKLLRLATSTATAASLGVCTHLASAAKREPLTVWFSVEGAKGVRLVAQKFTAQTGVPVIVDTPDDGPQKYQNAASAGKGPDIYVYAHDRIGEWIAGGLLQAVNPSKAVLDDIDPLAWKGFSYRDRVWGYPIAIEAITLVYNKALSPHAPRSFEDVLALDAQLQKQNKRAILWDYTNNYFTWPLLAANGGYAYRQRADGTFDARDTGVNNPGALMGAQLLERLLRDGLMPPASDYSQMEAAMAQGRVAMMINGPWSWVNLQKLGIDFGVAPIPTVAGKAPVPFVGIKGLMINRATRQRELAVEFIENHVLSLQGLRTLNSAEPLGAPASRSYLRELAADPIKGSKITGVMASAQQGLPTPSIPEMGRFWSAMKTSLTTLSEGRQTPQQALDAAARRILGS